MTRSANARAHLLVCLFLILATASVYLRVAGFDFTSLDDRMYVVKNPHVQAGMTADGIRWAFTTYYAANWHPLTWLSHMLDSQVYGMRPGGPHLTSLLFHVANTLLLFLLLSRMTGRMWRSAFVAALFALHPLHVESVAWVAERKDVLSTFFWMLTLLAYVSYGKNPSIKRYLLVAALFAMGLMAKPMLVTLPLVMLMLDYWPLARFALPQEAKVKKAKKNPWPGWKLVYEKIPLFALSAGSCVVTYLAQQSGGATRTVDDFTPGVRLANALVACVTYIGKMLWPRNLSAFYPHPENSLPVWMVVLSGMLLASLSVLLIRAGRRRPYLTVGWLWYIVTLVPVIGLVQVGHQAMADRYTYVPLIGLFVIVAWGVPELLARLQFRNAVLAAAGAAVMALLMACTWSQVGYWKDADTVFAHALEATSGNPTIHCLVARDLFDQGRTGEAFSHYHEALATDPHLALAHNDLGSIYAKQGKLDEAISEFEAALSSKPNMPQARNGLGFALLAQGKVDEAVPHLSRAVEIRPNYPDAQYNLGSALARQGDSEGAALHFTEALRLNPDMAEAHCSLASILMRQGNVEEAMSHLSEAVRIDPRRPEPHLLLGAAQLRQGKTDEALENMREAVRLRPDWGPAHNYLAAALAQIGDSEGAKREALLAKKYGRP